ncbi:3'-5' exoribonuclease YhaM family protein [Mariniblastus fucicola]|uniref:3'-5' exoribonuclease YhaM n=1 Tax=Mariniblastus fucicola TaxID=980251 RepID=A0A5B9PIP3_9BACT|nr:HD domain-containing protein [Mariniblastus fucicola]QEG24556.1 3'-5' exoribonuclease YhaM [Mariniblastus fucicola]
MTRRFVNELGDGENLDQVFLASEKQLRTNRNGNLYLQLRVSDRTGSLTAMLWNAQQKHFDCFENGDYVTVKGTAQVYNGSMQVLAREIKKSDGKVDEADFITLSTQKLESMVARLAEMLRSISSEPLRNLAECFLLDEDFMSSLKRAPAGVKNHHAYHGGLLDHMLSLMEVSLLVAPRYPELDQDLLLFGAFLHDLGKTRELTYSPDLGYSDQGQLLGHMVQGVVMLDEKIAEVEKQTDTEFPGKIADQLRHMIVSHHGTLEFGSPKVPMTLEAVALHYLDSLDAKLHSFQQLIEDDVNPNSAWTVYHPSIGRKIYKGK